MTTTKIEDGEFYSLGQIVKMNLIEGVDTIPKASRLMNHPTLGKILSPKIKPRGARGIQYKVKGANIKQYLQHEKDNKKNKTKSKNTA